MAYLTRDQLVGTAKFNNPIVENAARKSLTSRNTIFLSHSHEDADLILSAMNFLLTIGVGVYVDWLDKTMPSSTSGVTAAKIKTKIQECDRFVVLLSENSVDSKWVPWELGYADGVKDLNKIAIMPIRRSNYTTEHAFRGVEYMELYPVIKEGFSDNGRMIHASIFPPKRLGGNGKGWRIEGTWLPGGPVVHF